MLKTLAKPTALLAGGLFLISTSLPVQAEQMMRLDDAMLDQVTAGAAAGIQLGGALDPFGTAAAANGSLYSSSDVSGGIVGYGNQRSIVAYGLIVGVGVGASGTPGGATADAATTGAAIGDRTFVRTFRVGGNSRYGAFGGSATFALGLGLEL
jgi:hypothetical protein